MLHACRRNGTRAAAPIWPIALLIAALAIPSHAQNLNRNLVVNGDAETGAAAASATDSPVNSIPGWTTTGGFSVGGYDGSNFLSMSDYGPVDRGHKLFYGGPGNQRSTAVQAIDLSGAAAEIDGGRAKFYLSGYLGYLSGSSDNIKVINLKTEFQDAAGTVLLQSVADGPAQEDLSIPEGLLLRTATGWVPPNTRTAKVTIDLATSEGSYNAYAAVSISLTPTTDAMLGVNLLANGDGETDPSSDTGAPVPGWNGHSSLAVWKWGDYKMPNSTDPGPTDRGKYFFSCATNQSECKAYQTIDIGVAKKLVDAGKMSFQLSGWLGGDVGTPDNVSVNVAFFDANNAAVGGSAGIGPVTQQDRNGQVGLWQRSAGGAVPAGSRLAKVMVTFHRMRQDPENMAAYADNISLVLEAMQVTAVVNAASSQAGAVAPGEFVSIYGSSMGPSSAAISKGVEKGLGSVRVTFNGVEAFQTYASAGQINAVVPYGLTAKADVTVQYGARTSDVFPLALADSAPGIFTQQNGPGQAWAVNNDAQFNGKASPVSRGGWVEFWVTGQGLVDPTGQDGEPISGYKNLKLPVKVTIGGVDAPLLWAGLIYTGE